MKKELTKILKEFIKTLTCEDWQLANCWKAPQFLQLKSIFTTLCVVGDIEADTCECDTLLLNLYVENGLLAYIEYNDFENQMVEFIV